MPWQHGDLTDEAGASTPMESLVAYVTCLTSQGPVARVLYATPDNTTTSTSCSRSDRAAGGLRRYARHRSSSGSADRITSWPPYRSSSGASRMSGTSSRTRASGRGT